MLPVISRILLISSLCFSSSQIMAEGSWQKISDADEVEVYKKDIPGSPLFAFKGVKIMPVNIAKVTQVIIEEDAGKLKQWVDRLETFQILEKFEDRSISYSAFDMPWPVSDRDFVAEGRLIIDNENNQVLITLQSIDYPNAPKTVGVRALLEHSVYKLVPLPGGKTQVTVEIRTDPRGALPKWLVNLIQRSWPANSLKRMEQQALKPDTAENIWVKTKFKGLISSDAKP